MTTYTIFDKKLPQNVSYLYVYYIIEMLYHKDTLNVSSKPL